MAKQRWLTCFVPRRLELIVSPAWKARPVAVMRLIERLEEEHLRHGGVKNGELYVSYIQLKAAGLSKRIVRPALDCAKSLGLIEIRQDDEMRGDIRSANAYRLTYLQSGKSAPTDDWKRVNAEKAQTVVRTFRTVTGAAKTTLEETEKEEAIA